MAVSTRFRSRGYANRDPMKILNRLASSS